MFVERFNNKEFGTLFYKLVFLWIEPTQQIHKIVSNVAELDFSKILSDFARYRDG